MHISTITSGTLTVARFAGSFDTNTASEAQDYFDVLFAERVENVIVDFEALDFMSSAGLRVLIVAAKKLQATGGRIGICHANESVAEVFAMAQLPFFKLFPTRTAAIEGLGG